jgi:DNA modification methylase
MPRLKQRRGSETLFIEHLPPASLTPDPRNARKHTPKQIGKLAEIIRNLGWSSPVVIDEKGKVIAGHARLAAAIYLKLPTIPCVRLSHLNEAQKTALAIADNQMSDSSSFDDDQLRLLLRELTDVDFNMELTGFDPGELDFQLDGAAGQSPGDPADNVPPPPDTAAVSRPGDLWLLGEHRLLCGDALEESYYRQLLDSNLAGMVITDPPFNVPIAGHVSGLGRHKHREFAMASGEMSIEQFGDFLRGALSRAATFSRSGSLHYVFMDWRHIRLLLETGDQVYTELKNLCVWNKSNAGMGSLYRSKHELIAVFKNGAAPHCNNVELGRNGRHRANVWDYPGANAFGRTRDADLSAHPTVKPIALIADAIRDCTRRGDIVLDPFMGSGTTIMAAERSGRRAAGIELDPVYVDTAIRRWEKATGNRATLASDGRTFATIAAERSGTGVDMKEAGQ